MTFFEELGFWSKSIIRNCRTSKRVNELIQYLLDNKNRVEVEHYEDYYIVLKIDGNLYSFWIYGRYFAYLNRCWNCEEAKYPPLGQLIYQDEMPSRILCKQFYETFEKPIIEELKRLSQEEKAKSLILPSREIQGGATDEKVTCRR